ncbi:cyclase family protein [Salinigranum halophilum]|jgi:kynurenine formamidase|uniref:cyclase family protein n=1 Tax=Salinigranum halophilum TaxID=2565931 RepID=UPI0010A7EE23|nr:cyclase family protein [Salinigranum halophilum]
MLDSKEVIELSNPITEGIPVWPSFPQIELDQTSLAARDGFTMERLEMRSHTATHIDAPAHFIPEGKTLDDFSIESFMGEGVVIDLTPKEPEEPITRADIEAYESDIQPGDVVMLHTGWDEYYGQTPEYLFEFPYLTGEAAEYVVSLDPKAVGTEGASVGGWYDEVPAHGPSTDVHPADSHLPLLENDVFPIEELRNLDQVLDGADSRRADFFFPPLNVQGTGGCSVRAFALV